jgi:DNA-binding transcriptional MerR regulator
MMKAFIRLIVQSAKETRKMLKIGDFSRLSQVSIKILRHYDDIGLFKPAQVDRFTGYRYYTLDQLPRLNQILALKDLGLSLEQITNLLNENIVLDQIQVMLRLKRAELQQQMADTQARLVRVEMRLRHIEMEDKMVDYEILVKRVEAQRVLAIREVAHTVNDISRLFEEVNQALQQHGIKSAAPWIAMYHHQGYRETDMDLEIAIPVKESVTENLPLDRERHMTIRTIPAIETAVSTLLQGNYTAIGDVYAALSRYIYTNGYGFVGPAREVYIRGPKHSSNVDDYLTEIQEPVSKITGEIVFEDSDFPEGWKDFRPVRIPYSQFSQRARQALQFAEVAAEKLGQPQILPVHVLLGLLQEKDGMAGVVLQNSKLTLDTIQGKMPVGSKPTLEPQISGAARQIVVYASREAQQLGHDYIGTEHLLLGLLQQGEADILQIFVENGISPAQIRSEVLRLVNSL